MFSNKSLRLSIIFSSSSVFCNFPGNRTFCLCCVGLRERHCCPLRKPILLSMYLFTVGIFWASLRISRQWILVFIRPRVVSSVRCQVCFPDDRDHSLPPSLEQSVALFWSVLILSSCEIFQVSWIGCRAPMLHDAAPVQFVPTDYSRFVMR